MQIMEAIYENRNFLSVCEFLPNQLYFVTVQNINNGGSCDAVIPNTDDLHFFTTDTELTYSNYYGDFGPLNIMCLYKFCKKLINKLATYAGDLFYEKFVTSRFGRKEVVEKLQEKFVKRKAVIYYTSTNNDKRANAAFLISSFAVLYLGFSPRAAHKALQPTKLRYRPFQDASVGLSCYKISMKDCLDAIHKASVFGFFNFNDFNAAECTFYENLEHGDLSWIVPQKFLAFPGPVQEKSDYYQHPNSYVEYFLMNSVSDVIRLNQKAYDGKCFTMFGIKHHDLYMMDGADPPAPVLKKFMSISENADGAIAVHCKAGLGRTGSLIGAYLLKHYRMTAKEAIAWIRVCRPGSVIGHQQAWLENLEEALWYEGNEWRFKMYGKTEIVPFLQYGIYSYESPKKEYPGLRELISNICRRSKYRFLVKNRPKLSKAKLQQMIRNILQQGKSAQDKSEDADHERKPEPVLSHQKIITSSRKTDAKNIEYLKSPPRISHEEYENYPQHHIREPPVQVSYPPYNEYYHTGYYAPPTDSYESKPIVNTNHSQYYPAYMENDYFVPACPERKPTPASQTREFPKSLSVGVQRQERIRPNLISKSIDKNWKQNNPSGMRYFSSENPPRKFPNEETVLKNCNYDVDVCAFDPKVDTLTQYSRFNRPCFGRGYLEEPPAYTEKDYFFNENNSRQRCEYSKSSRDASGYILSPDDMQSWVETFDDNKIGHSQGDKLNAIKRSKVT